jgi:hypothetical protein
MLELVSLKLWKARLFPSILADRKLSVVIAMTAWMDGRPLEDYLFAERRAVDEVIRGHGVRDISAGRMHGSQGNRVEATVATGYRAADAC